MKPYRFFLLILLCILSMPILMTSCFTVIASLDAKKFDIVAAQVMVSNWLFPINQERCQLRSGQFIQLLLIDDRREFYLAYHRHFVFKG